jgi:hypothetical protein
MRAFRVIQSASSTYLNPLTAYTSRRTIATMASSFPPQEVRGLVQEIATLLRERKETVSVAETVESMLIEVLAYVLK